MELFKENSKIELKTQELKKRRVKIMRWLIIYRKDKKNIRNNRNNKLKKLIVEI